ncbi:MAG: SAM-dependent methyltransferase, partial [Myxococcales bacterium]|nr:SAM-dependent methyltransferase [Myxococcales bacterium]
MKEGRASRTAEYVALFRAIESALPARRRLFEDPFARSFLRPSLRAVAALCRVPGVADLLARFIDRRWAGARSSAVARTSFIDDTIRAALGQGIEQLVILGAGFDCRAYRLDGLSRLSLFEVDHPDTLARKQIILARASVDVPSEVRFVGIDFKSGDLDRAMAAAGWSEEVRTFILWEGVTTYLSEAAVDTTLRWCARAAPGSLLLFTYVDRAVIDEPRAFAGTERLRATLKAAGEQWTFGLDPAALASFLSRRGLQLEQDIGSADYRARYLPEVSRVMRGYEFYRIAIARVPSRTERE